MISFLKESWRSNYKEVNFWVGAFYMLVAIFAPLDRLLVVIIAVWGFLMAVSSNLWRGSAKKWEKLAWAALDSWKQSQLNRGAFSLFPRRGLH